MADCLSTLKKVKSKKNWISACVGMTLLRQRATQGRKKINVEH